MTCRPAPACTAFLAQLTKLHPERSTASDGICGDASHQQRKSDHNEGNAADATNDPIHGVDIHWELRQLTKRKDKRVKYIISNGQIWHYLFPIWVKYFGTNPHVKHGHVSIKSAHRDDTSPWWPQKRKRKVKHKKIRLKLNDVGAKNTFTDVSYKKLAGWWITDTGKGIKTPVVSLEESGGIVKVEVSAGEPKSTISIVLATID